MHPVEPTQVLIGLAGSIQLLLAITLIAHVILNPSEIRLSLWEAVRRALRPAPLWLQWAFLKVLVWRFGRETLAAGLMCGAIYTWWHITTAITRRQEFAHPCENAATAARVHRFVGCSSDRRQSATMYSMNRDRKSASASASRRNSTSPRWNPLTSPSMLSVSRPRRLSQYLLRRG